MKGVTKIRKRTIAGIIVLLLILLGGGIFWFDYLGVLNVRMIVTDIAGRVGFVRSSTGFEVFDDSFLIERERLEKREMAVQLKQIELNTQAQMIEAQEQEFLTRQQDLDSREQEIEQREKSFMVRLNQYENKREVLEQNARDLTNMRPQNAVAILEGYDDQLIIDTLRVVEEIARESGQLSLVPVWLSSLPPERVATIQRKMTIKTDN